MYVYRNSWQTFLGRIIANILQIFLRYVWFHLKIQIILADWSNNATEADQWTRKIRQCRGSGKETRLHSEIDYYDIIIYGTIYNGIQIRDTMNRVLY